MCSAKCVYPYLPEIWRSTWTKSIVASDHTSVISVEHPMAKNLNWKHTWLDTRRPRGTTVCTVIILLRKRAIIKVSNSFMAVYKIWEIYDTGSWFRRYLYISMAKYVMWVVGPGSVWLDLCIGQSLKGISHFSSLPCLYRYASQLTMLEVMSQCDMIWMTWTITRFNWIRVCVCPY